MLNQVMFYVSMKRLLDTNDVLNIRSSPSATSAIIGFLEPDQKWIEVIARDSSAKWGLVNSGETAGWVSLHYMARARQGNWLDLENMLSCFGTEPFWSLQMDSSHAVFDINGKANNYVLQNHGRAANRNHKSGFGARSSSDPRLSLTGIISAQSCSDGMSDQEYGISVDLVLFKNADLSVLSGCCSVQP